MLQISKDLKFIATPYSHLEFAIALAVFRELYHRNLLFLYVNELTNPNAQCKIAPKNEEVVLETNSFTFYS